MSILAALSMGTIKNPEVMFGDLMMIAIKWKEWNEMRVLETT